MIDEIPADARLEIKFVAETSRYHELEQWIRLHPAGFRKSYPPRRVNNIYFDTQDLDAGRRIIARFVDPLEDRRSTKAIVAEVGGNKTQIEGIDHSVGIDIGGRDIIRIGRRLIPQAEDQVGIGDIDLVITRGVAAAEETQ